MGEEEKVIQAAVKSTPADETITYPQDKYDAIEWVELSKKQRQDVIDEDSEYEKQEDLESQKLENEKDFKRRIWKRQNIIKNDISRYVKEKYPHIKHTQDFGQDSKYLIFEPPEADDIKIRISDHDAPQGGYNARTGERYQRPDMKMFCLPEDLLPKPDQDR